MVLPSLQQITPAPPCTFRKAGLAFLDILAAKEYNFGRHRRVSHRNSNPYRYRSYYYDTETGLYYLQSRYNNGVAFGEEASAGSVCPNGQLRRGKIEEGVSLLEKENQSQNVGNTTLHYRCSFVSFGELV